MSAVSVASSLLNILTKLKEELGKREQKKDVADKLASALGDDIEDYMAVFREISCMSQKELVPLIESIGNMPTKSQIDRLVAHTTQTQQEYSELLEILIQLAKRCSIISEMEGFMRNLMNTDTMMGDFVKVLGNAYVKKSDSVKIDDEFYLFFKINEKLLLKDLEESDIEAITERFEGYLAVVKKRVVPYLSVSSISRENRRQFMRSLQRITRIGKRVKAKKTDIVDLKTYTPAKLLPIIALMEESLSYAEKYVKRRYPILKRHAT